VTVGTTRHNIAPCSKNMHPYISLIKKLCHFIQTCSVKQDNHSVTCKGTFDISNNEALRSDASALCNHSSRIRFLRFLKIQKRDFLHFFEAAFQKNVIHNLKFQTLLTFHYMESPLQLKTMYVYNIYGPSSCVKDNKSD